MAEDAHTKREAGVQGTIAALNKKYGKNSVTTMASSAYEIPRISTGLLLLDLALAGGFPKGRMVEVFGPEESGKTTMLARVLKNAQRCCVHCGMRATFEVRGTIVVDLPMGMKKEVPNHVIVDCPCHNPRQFYGLWQDIEGTFDPVWFEANGVWLERCFLARPVTVEEAIDLGQGVLESGQFDALFLDSIAMGTTMEEIEKSAADAGRVGGASKHWNSAMRRWQMMQNQAYKKAVENKNPYAASLVPSVFMVNQVREKIGMFVGDPETTPGGKGVRFACSTRIRASGESVKPKKGSDGDSGGDGDSEKDDPMMFHKMRFKVKKSKISPSGYGGEYLICQQKTRFHNMGDVDQDFDLVKYGVSTGIISGAQNAYYMPGVFQMDTDDKPTSDPVRFRGKSQMEEYLATHHDYAEVIYNKIVAKMTGTYYDGEIRKDALGEDYVPQEPTFEDGEDIEVV